jgi:predicted RecA/RadA family phage recombinase
MRTAAIAMWTALSLGTAGLALAEEAAKPKGEIANITTVTATVVAIDLKKRLVTLKGPKGNEFQVEADQRVKNLPQVKVGDKVDVGYYESIAWNVRKAGDGVSGGSSKSGVATAPPGEKPAAAVGSQVTITARIEAIDPAGGTVTLTGPLGNSKTIKARDPKNLERVKVGDLVDITYTEALAVQVRPAK